MPAGSLPSERHVHGFVSFQGMTPIRAEILRLQYERNAAPKRQQLYYTLKIAALIRAEARTPA